MAKQHDRTSGFGSGFSSGFRPGFRWRQRWQAIAIVLVLLLVLATPGMAQEALKAPAVIDGAELFRVGSSGGFEARERAEPINMQLQIAVESGTAPQVEVTGSTELPTVLLNGKHLLTVTDRDTLPGRTHQEQAQIWATQIEQRVQQAQQERQPQFLQRAALWSVATVALALLLHWGLGRFWQRVLRPELRAVTYIPDPDGPTNDQPASLDILLTLLLVVVRTGLWLGTVFYVFNQFPWTRRWSYEFIGILKNSFFSPIVTLGNRQYSLTNLLILAASLFVLEIVTKTVTNIIRSRVLRVAVVNRGAREAIAVVIRYGLLFIGALVLLQAWGVDISSLAILVSALGIGIGLGLQDIAKDIGSGLVLLFERPIQVGDFVQVGDFEGTIERIGARSTLVRTLDHISIIVPNARFLASEVINWSHDNPVSRLHLPIGVAYGSDLQAVQAALLDAARANPKVLSTPKPQVVFRGFGDSSLNLELLVWTAEPSRQLILKSELYFSIEAQLRHYQVEIPFPQQDLHVRSGSLPIDLSPQLEHTLRQLLKYAQNGQSEHSDKIGKEEG